MSAGSNSAIAFVLLACSLPAQTAVDIIRRACERETLNVDLRQKYLYRQTSEQKQFDDRGRVKESKSKIEEVMWIKGIRYTRLLAKDGKPVAAERPSADKPRNLNDEREMRRQVPDAFDFTMLGTESVNGRDCWKIRAEPKPGFKGTGRAASMLPKMRGVFWIDREAYEFARLQVETLDTISFGFGLFRIGKGANIELQQALVNNEVWFPTSLHIALNARALLLLGGNFDLASRFHDFRKFAVDSEVQVSEQ